MAKRNMTPRVHLSTSTLSVFNVPGCAKLLDGKQEQIVIIQHDEKKGILYLTPIQASGVITVLTLRRHALNNAVVSLNSYLRKLKVRSGHYPVFWDEKNKRLEISLDA